MRGRLRLVFGEHRRDRLEQVLLIVKVAEFLRQVAQIAHPLL
jgi:hypothetical protein